MRQERASPRPWVSRRASDRRERRRTIAPAPPPLPIRPRSSHASVSPAHDDAAEPASRLLDRERSDVRQAAAPEERLPRLEEEESWRGAEGGIGLDVPPAFEEPEEDVRPPAPSWCGRGAFRGDDPPAGTNHPPE